MWLALLFLVWGPQDPEKTVAERLMTHVEALSDDKLEGRNAGTEGAAKAAQYIVQRFREYGLRSGPNGTHVQRFPFDVSDRAGKKLLLPRRGKAFNLLGLVEGTSRKDEVVLVVSHYDHLGKKGEWDPGRLGKPAGDPIWNGANDNASGMAALLFLAESLSQIPPARSFVFIAFAAKEHGRAGSSWYRENPAIPFDQTAFVLVLDRIGRFRDVPLEIHGAGTAKELRPIVKKVLEREKLSAEVFNHADVRAPTGDHVSFFEEGIPTLLLSAPAHGTDRGPGDDATTVDPAALEKVARSALGILREVDASTDPLTFQGGRRFGFLLGGISTGRFAETAKLGKNGGAIFVWEVTAGSVAAKAGLRKGDWIFSLKETTFPRTGVVRVFRRVLDRLSPGKPVPVGVVREGKKIVLVAEWPE